MGSLSLLQGIFPTQGWNPGLLHHRQILYQLSHKGSPHPNLFRSIHMATDGMISCLKDMKPFLSSSKGLKQLVMFYSKIGLPRGDHAQGTFWAHGDSSGLVLSEPHSGVLLDATQTAPNSLLPLSALSQVSSGLPLLGKLALLKHFPCQHALPYNACEAMQASRMADSWVLSLKITNALGCGSINLTSGNFSICSFHIYNRTNVLI